MANRQAGDINQDAITKKIMVAKTGDDFELIKSPLNEDFDEKSENKSAVYDQKVVER